MFRHLGQRGARGGVSVGGSPKKKQNANPNLDAVDLMLPKDDPEAAAAIAAPPKRTS